jgi:tetratricopeptide (TPR) repeat protein
MRVLVIRPAVTRPAAMAWVLASACALLVTAPVLGQTPAAPAGAGTRRSTPSTQAPPKTSPPPRAPARPSFATLSTNAESAREKGLLAEAAELYRQALAIKPDWPEGRWSLGTTLYELDRFEEARDQFRRVLSRHDDNGTAWALKGLCEYRLKNYDTALSDLLKARARGVTGSREVSEVARYHTALLATRTEQFEQALGILSDFGLEGNDSPSIIEAMGLATLRLPLLPDELPGEKREMVMMAGRARYFMAARLGSAATNAFDALVARYPETPNVNYAAGVYLLAEQPEKAVEAFKRELKVFPQNVWARIQIAFALIRTGEYEAARPFAEEAVAVAPTEFVARNALGQVLLETGDTAGAVRELEAGVKLASDSPQMHFALARAYRRAGRTADADKAQAEFTRLDRMVRASRTGEASVGGIDISAAPPRKQ